MTASIDNEKFMDAVDLAEKEFASMTPLANRYCSAPPSYRDPKMHKQKKHNKIYYQFIKENYDLLKLKYNDALANNQSAIAFLDTMVAIDQMAKKMFTDILDQMDKDYPGIKAIFYGNHDELTVITKIVRYEKTDNWGTTAHFDKSGLSFIWNSDDDNDDSLMTCKDVLTPSLDLLQKPVRLYGNRPDVSSTILIAGSAFSKVGINIRPTLH